MVFKYLFPFFLASTLVSCSLKNKDKSTDDKLNEASELEGNWKYCYKSSGEDEILNRYDMEYVSYKDGVFSIIYTSGHATGLCATTPDTHIKFEYKVIGQRLLFDEPSQSLTLDLQFFSGAYTLNSESVVEYSNQQALCGKKDWKKEETVNFTSLIKCGEENLPVDGEILYTIYKVDKDKLYLGEPKDSNNGETETVRIKVLSEKPLEKKFL